MQSKETVLNDIQRLKFEDSFDLLLVGETQLPIVTHPANTPIERGVAVLISEAGHGPFSQHGLPQLSGFLNDVGWATIIMPAPVTAFETSLNAMETEQPNPADTDNPQTQESENPPPGKNVLAAIKQQEFDAHEQQLMLYMQAVGQRVQQYPGFFLVVSKGTTAAWLTKMYAEQSLTLPDGMVAISPQWPVREYNMQLPNFVAQTPMPYLDIYSPWDSSWALATVQARQIEAKRSLKMVYRQRELIGTQMDQEQYARLSKEIYGWLTYMGW